MSWRDRMTQFPERESWLAARPPVTGSVVPRILGIHGSPLEEWAKLRGYMPADPPAVTFQMRRGTYLEEFLAGELQREVREAGNNWTVVRLDNSVVMHEAHAWAGYSPDGFAIDSADETDVGLVETKAWSPFSARYWGAEAEGSLQCVPASVYAQVQHGMWVMGLPFALVGADIGDFVWAGIDRDEEWLGETVPKLVEFMDCVEQDIPPEPTGSGTETDILNGLRPDSVEETHLDAAWLGATRKLLECVEERKELAKLEDAIKNRVRRELVRASATVGLVQGLGAWHWTETKSGAKRLDFKEA